MLQSSRLTPPVLVAHIGRKPANQYLGADLQTVQLSGAILPHFKGGLHQIDLMRTAANAAKPLLLVDGRGFVHGDRVVKQISEDQSVLHANGAAHKIGFSLSLEEYGSDQGSMSALPLGVSVASTLARFL